MQILLVEDDADDAEFLAMCLRRYDNHALRITRVATLAGAQEALQGHSFDVVLLDLHLPDASGVECVERIQQINDAIPIVVLSGQADEEFAVGILNHGVQDYLVKWEGDGRIILRSIRYAVERKRAESRLNYLARFDSLTDIPNRKYLQEQLERATKRARRAGKKIGLLFLDLDRFKVVNDTLGHKFGDQLLREVVIRLQASIRSGDLLARLGGDEFAVMVEDVGGALEIEAVAKKILEAFESPFDLGGRCVSATASIGITIYPSDNGDPSGLLNTADIAMYRAKDRGRNNFKFYTQEMHDSILRYHQMESDLRRALENDEFTLVYQPQVRLDNLEIYALEALLRWNHPQRGFVAPDDFISVAEESGYIVPIGKWVIDRVCRQLCEWMAAGFQVPRVAINIAPIHFHQPDFVRQVRSTLAIHGIEPSKIELELTERSLMNDTQYTRQCLGELRDHGVRLSIDDFGTGYSCLSYLRHFPIDVLKIDRSFVSDLATSPDGQAICSVVVSIARKLALDCVAEGIEDTAQLEFLRAQGCEYGQGYLFSRPEVPSAIATRFLMRVTPSDAKFAAMRDAQTGVHP